MLKGAGQGLLDDEHYGYLQDSINTMISMLHRYDVAMIAATELRYRRDPGFRGRLDMRAAVLDGYSNPQAQSIHGRSVDLIARAVVVNSGMLFAPLFPLALLGVGFSALQRRIRKFATLSRRDLESITPERLGVATS